MEDWLFYSLTTLLCVLCSLLLRSRSLGSSKAKAHAAAADGSPLPPLPPGPAPLPVLGPLLFLARRDFDIEPTLRRIARDHGPVFTFAPLGRSRPTIFVDDRAAAHHTLVQHDAAFASHPPATSGSDGDRKAWSGGGGEGRACLPGAASQIRVGGALQPGREG